MENIIEPIDRKLLEAELTPERFLRKTNAADNDIYMIDAHNAPNVMLEIGRLREITFRAAGGGTGKSVDIDEFDTCEVPFKQRPMPFFVLMLTCAGCSRLWRVPSPTTIQRFLSWDATRSSYAIQIYNGFRHTMPSLNSRRGKAKKHQYWPTRC